MHPVLVAKLKGLADWAAAAPSASRALGYRQAALGLISSSSCRRRLREGGSDAAADAPGPGIRMARVTASQQSRLRAQKLNSKAPVNGGGSFGGQTYYTGSEGVAEDAAASKLNSAGKALSDPGPGGVGSGSGEDAAAAAAASASKSSDRVEGEGIHDMIQADAYAPVSENL